MPTSRSLRLSLSTLHRISRKQRHRLSRSVSLAPEEIRLPDLPNERKEARSKLYHHRRSGSSFPLQNHTSQGLVLGRSYSDPQEGFSGFLLLANREVSVRAVTAETPTITTVTSKRNFMISIFWFCLRFCSFYLESQSQRIPPPGSTFSCPLSILVVQALNEPTFQNAQRSFAADIITVFGTRPLIFTLPLVNWA